MFFKIIIKKIVIGIINKYVYSLYQSIETLTSYENWEVEDYNYKDIICK